MEPEIRYLLILGCSRRKRAGAGLLPAIERYDGINFRIVRKAGRSGVLRPNLDIFIISAKYGLLDSCTLIEDYDLKMTEARASELRPEMVAQLAEQVSSVIYIEVFVNLGRLYLGAIEGWDANINDNVQVLHPTGGIGRKASAMRGWLWAIR